MSSWGGDEGAERPSQHSRAEAVGFADTCRLRRAETADQNTQLGDHCGTGSSSLIPRVVLTNVLQHIRGLSIAHSSPGATHPPCIGLTSIL